MTIRTFCIPGLLLALLLVAAPFPGAVLQAQELKWAKSAGGDVYDSGLGIATDPRGNSYVTGYFVATAVFGPGEPNETVLEAEIGGENPDGNMDVFVAKYAPDGTLLWTTSAGGVCSDSGAGIATDPRGNSYVTGGFQGTATFGAGEANETVLEAGDSCDGDEPSVFVAKYAPDGTLLWATRAGGAGSDRGADIAMDARGNSYVTGHFRGAATFGAGEANETVLEAAGFGMFVAKYARDGTLLWATSPRGARSGAGIATDSRGNSYLTAGFQGTATFGAGEANETVLEGSGAFVAKYAPDGTLLWAARAGGAGDIATDPRGNIYLTGGFQGTATFGAGEANETVLTTAGGRDAFVAKYAPDGTLLWATRAGGAGLDFGADIATATAT